MNVQRTVSLQEATPKESSSSVLYCILRNKRPVDKTLSETCTLTVTFSQDLRVWYSYDRVLQ